MIASAKSQRALIWLTWAMTGVYFAGFAVMMRFFPAPSPLQSAAQVQVLYASHNVELRLGVVLCLVSGAFLLPWSVVIGVQMARLEKGVPIWAILQALAGAVGSFLLWGPPMFWGIAAFDVARDPALTQLMHETGWLIFITVDSLFPMQLAAISVVAFTKSEDDRVSAFPRWLGYLTIWQALQSLGGLGAMLIHTGPFAWNGIFAFYLPLTLFGVWMLAMTYTLLRAIRHQEGAARGAVPYGARAAE